MTYEFESTSSARLGLILILGTILMTLWIYCSSLILDSAQFIKSHEEAVIVVLSIAGVAIFYFLGKKYLRQESTIRLKDETLIFTRDGRTRQIKISEIESYKYKLVQGVRLNIWTRRNEKISIIANDVFCKYEGLEKFCTDFDNYVNSKKTAKTAASNDSHYVNTSTRVDDTAKNSGHSKTVSEIKLNKPKSRTQVESEPLKVSPDSEDLIPKRKKSFYEKKYAQPFLIAFTVLVIAFVIYVIVDGGNLPAAIIVSAGGLSAMWAGYFNHQEK